MDKGLTVGIKDYTIVGDLENTSWRGQIPPLAADIWKLPDNRDIKGDLWLILTSDKQDGNKTWQYPELIWEDKLTKVLSSVNRDDSEI